MAKKESVTLSVNNLPEAESALREVGRCRLQIERIEYSMNTDIDRAKVEAAERAAPLTAKARELEAALEQFWLTRRDPNGPKSARLNFGEIGTRASRAVRWLRGWDAEKVLAALGNGFVDFIRIKHSINKEAILQAAPERLAELRKCGVGTEEREKFFAEPDLERIRAASEPAA